MQKTEFNFLDKSVSCYFDADFSLIQQLAVGRQIFIITDDNLIKLYPALFKPFSLFSITPGESSKVQAIVDRILQSLIEMEADRNVMIVGVGGGVVTDIAGYIASVYKRGVSLALVPTTLLGMVDAALGGKNGVNAGIYKNIIGTIYQPQFILYDYSFLSSLPIDEWINGFAEIIKHACIRDKLMFEMLERYSLHDFQTDLTLAASIIEQNVHLKMDIATSDEFDTDVRLLLNFGHTIGHALENLHDLSHGNAISIGMVAACNLSEIISKLHLDEAVRVVKLLSRYHLPVDIETDVEKVYEILKLDKKREGDDIRFILLNGIGKPEVRPISIAFLHENLKSIL